MVATQASKVSEPAPKAAWEFASGDEIVPEVPLRYSGLNRIPILLLGPLLHLHQEAFVPVVGGDRIGPVSGRMDFEGRGHSPATTTSQLAPSMTPLTRARDPA